MVEQRVYGKLRIYRHKGRNIIYQVGVPPLRTDDSLFGLELVIYGYEKKITELGRDFYDIQYEPLLRSEAYIISKILSKPEIKVREANQKI